MQQDKFPGWDDIRFFAMVCEHGSFSAAARAQGTTQATISRRMQKLEQLLGSALFVRGNEGSVLTPAGQRLYPKALQMQKTADGFEHEWRQLQGGSTRIVVTCGSLIGLFLSKHIGQLVAGLENCEIDLQLTNRFLSLEQGEADLALRNLRPERGQLLAKRIRSAGYGGFAVFGARQYFSDEDTLSDIEALRVLPWVSYNRNQSDAPTARWIAANIGERAVVFRLNSAANILEAIKQNRAVALLPQFIGRDESELVELYGPVDTLNMEMWAVRRESSRHDPNLSRLIDNVETLFASESK